MIVLIFIVLVTILWALVSILKQNGARNKIDLIRITSQEYNKFYEDLDKEWADKDLSDPAVLEHLDHKMYRAAVVMQATWNSLDVREEGYRVDIPLPPRNRVTSAVSMWRIDQKLKEFSDSLKQK